MTMLRRWGFATWAGLAALLIAVAMAAQPALRAEVVGDAVPLMLVSWTPMLVGAIMTWAFIRGFGNRDALDLQVANSLIGHPINRELVWLGLTLAGFIASMFLLTQLFGVYEAEIEADLAMSAALVSRLLFLFVLPLLLLDRSGITVDGWGTEMPVTGLKVTEPWRWLALIPVVIALIMIGYLVTPYIGLPGPSVALAGYLFAFVLIAFCEEAFFRGMVQTRLETVMGRWGGIMAASVFFGLTYALVQPYDALSQLPGSDLLHNIGLALLTYSAASLFYGYLWACFRNLWANVVMRVGVFYLLMPPSLQVGIA